ncbi:MULTISPECIES: hypothetical protein [Elizabethkingia]|uniref:hypothetical protein n=1 Tax=Elizabethkingia TaxID=308865 RepID=UPI000999292F|nr:MULTISPECIES: hypothetical protein [Elizabethkingia]AQX90545.1 hypothetical protein AYC67_16645 [Elizabethkingia anophelis]EHM7980960.1 hypothetical protein [Elizabethkingia anophelis]EHM8032179.1 hypothetical protein [Elizabethkingia anophelis]EHM8033928.1 hypothetical protein [Elizabethkingia anophelis]EHZ9535133.1 hypothetical protein [Elizabethkingia anophelis]
MKNLLKIGCFLMMLCGLNSCVSLPTTYDNGPLEPGQTVFRKQGYNRTYNNRTYNNRNSDNRIPEPGQLEMRSQNNNNNIPEPGQTEMKSQNNNNIPEPGQTEMKKQEEEEEDN